MPRPPRPSLAPPPLAALLALLLLAAAPRAQDDGAPVTLGTWRVLPSEHLDTTRRVVVALPPGYDDEPERRYPVLVLLDGDPEGLFLEAAGLARFLGRAELTPELLVVGVANHDRRRDFTPASAEPDPRLPTAGGAAAFADFLEHELLPFVDREYRSTDYRVLAGHSLGGLFAVHLWLERPALFDAHVAASPSLWFDDDAVVERLAERLAAEPPPGGCLYLTLGNETGDMQRAYERAVQLLEDHAPPALAWAARRMPEENHATVVHRSLRQGLEFAFDDWDLRDILARYDAGGLPAVAAPLARAAERYGVPRPLDSGVLGGLAFTLTEAGRLDDAAAVLDHDPEGAPPIPWAQSKLADALREAGRREDALQRYVDVLAEHPDHAAARAGLAALFAQARPAPPEAADR